MSLLVEKGILTNDEIEVRISIINAGLAEECIQKHGDAAKVFISRLMEWNK